MLAALAIVLAFQQEPAVLDTAAYANAEWQVSFPRPFDDWIFLPATSRGTTTVIFQPRNATLSDQLWGALVLTHWGRAVELADVADRRTRSTWRETLGPTFALLTRDSLDVSGWPAIHLVMSGAIRRAVLDIEEYLIARDSDLVVLQLRYPRGVPRDSVAAAFHRVVEGLRIGGAHRGAAAPVAEQPPASAVRALLELGQLRIDLPARFTAVAPGMLTADAASGEFRLMRWRPLIGGVDTSLYAVGLYRLETRRVGRLTVRIWREGSGDSLVARVTDQTLAHVVGAWRTFWHAFGPVPVTELTLVETAWAGTRGGGAALFVGADASELAVARELSRTWWGGAVAADPRTAALLLEALPAWSAALATGDTSRLDDAAHALVVARRTAGDPRFREALRTFVAESRDGTAAIARLYDVLGDEAASSVRQLVMPQ